MRRVTTWYLVLLNLYWVGLSFMWNSLHVIILPAVLLNFVPDSQKNSYLGVLTFFGLILALIVQPISGAISDRWASRWGRRRPLMALGTAIDFIFLALLGWAGGLWMLFVGYIGLQISSNVAHGPAQGLLPDRVLPEQLGAARGIKNLMDMAGLVAASLLIGRMVAPDEKHPVAAMAVVMLLLASGALITLVGVREEPTEGQARPSQCWTERLRQEFRLDWHAHTSYWWLIASRFFYLFGVYGIQVFAQYFVRDRLDVPNPVKTTGDLMAAIVLALMACSLGAGWLCDRWGRRPVQALAGVIGATGALLLITVHTPTQLLIYGAIVGAGIGIFLSANWALANELAPAEEAGKFLGLTNLATAGAGAVGRLEGPFIALLNNAHPGEWWGWTMLFGLGAVCILLSAVLLVKVKDPKGLQDL